MLDVEHLLADLTPPQRQAATHVDGPLLIIAGAGSGKTRVITRRVVYLLEQGIPPWSILAITFTNKAAGEMKSRVANVIGKPLRDFGRLDQPWPLVCTFHSLCLRILRHYATRIGLPLNFSIFDSADQTKLIKEALKMLDVSSTNFSPSTVHATISNAKNQLVGAEDFARKAGDFYQRTVARVFTKYQQLLKQNNALDFDDLLLRTAEAFRAHPDMLRELQERFQYLLIDEYQDTNRAQYVMAHALAMRHQNICVVGDPDQSIYAWRGADLRNILDFEKDYPGAVTVRLEQNYRSTQRILRIASKLIANNIQRKDKTLWTKNVEGEPANLFLCQDEHDEAAIVTDKLRVLHDTCNYDWSKMAIFYRMNALSRVMEDALRKAAVPYQIARGVEFYNRKEIRDALAYLRVVANPSDEVSLTRIVNVPTRGLGDAAIKTMTGHAYGHGLSLWEAMERAASITGLSARAVNAARQFVQMVNRWRTMAGHPASVAQTSVAGSLPTDAPFDAMPALCNGLRSWTSAKGFSRRWMRGANRMIRPWPIFFRWMIPPVGRWSWKIPPTPMSRKPWMFNPRKFNPRKFNPWKCNRAGRQPIPRRLAGRVGRRRESATSPKRSFDKAGLKTTSARLAAKNWTNCATSRNSSVPPPTLKKKTLKDRSTIFWPRSVL